MLIFSPAVIAWQYHEHAVALMALKRFDEAILNFNEALKINPKDPYSHWNRGAALLSIGNYVKGFEELEWRWQVFEWCWGQLETGIRRIETIPYWNGEDVSGKRLLLYQEHGFGDAIMISRFIPEIKARGAIITLLTLPVLKRLMMANFDVEVIDKVPEDLSGFDLRCGLFSPLRYLQHTVLSIPKKPYLKAELDPKPGTIGICWSGNTQKVYTAESFLKHLKAPTDRRIEIQALQLAEAPAYIRPLVSKDFFDTLDVIRRMERIVTVDTAVAHLAGACGHPAVHVILPEIHDWRWYHGYAWYPNLHLHHDWDSLNAAVAE